MNKQDRIDNQFIKEALKLLKIPHFEIRCKICISPYRNYIEYLSLMEGCSFRKIQNIMEYEGYKFSIMSLSRHFRHHVDYERWKRLKMVR